MQWWVLDIANYAAAQYHSMTYRAMRGIRAKSPVSQRIPAAPLNASTCVDERMNHTRTHPRGRQRMRDGPRQAAGFIGDSWDLRSGALRA